MNTAAWTGEKLISNIIRWFHVGYDCLRKKIVFMWPGTVDNKNKGTWKKTHLNKKITPKHLIHVSLQPVQLKIKLITNKLKMNEYVTLQMQRYANCSYNELTSPISLRGSSGDFKFKQVMCLPFPAETNVSAWFQCRPKADMYITETASVLGADDG